MTLILTDDLPDPATQRTLASRRARLGAFVIDVILIDGGLLMPPLLAAVWLVLLVVLNVWGVLMHGQTVGKLLMKIRIVDPDTNLPPGFMRAAVIRSGPQTILAMTFPVAGLVYMVVDGLCIFSRTRRCLHDRLSRTLVIVGTREWWWRSRGARHSEVDLPVRSPAL
jgi:uncharacterized RDD family membrane protein YckC